LNAFFDVVIRHADKSPYKEPVTGGVTDQNFIFLELASAAELEAHVASWCKR